MILHHITLATGHSATHRLDTLDAGAVEACRKLLPAGGTIPGFAPFRVEIVAPGFTILRGREPLVSCALGDGPSGPWQMLIDLQANFAPPPPGGWPKAPRTSWLAVAILPPLSAQRPADIAWMGDFERCLAAAMLLQKTNE